MCKQNSLYSIIEATVYLFRTLFKVNCLSWVYPSNCSSQLMWRDQVCLGCCPDKCSFRLLSREYSYKLLSRQLFFQAVVQTTAHLGCCPKTNTVLDTIQRLLGLLRVDSRLPWPPPDHSNLSQLKSSSMSSPWRKLGRVEMLPCDENPSPAACNSITISNSSALSHYNQFCANNR